MLQGVTVLLLSETIYLCSQQGFKNFDVTTIAKKWIEMKQRNNGVHLQAVNEIDFFEIRFISDDGAPNKRPKLIVDCTNV